MTATRTGALASRGSLEHLPSLSVATPATICPGVLSPLTSRLHSQAAPTRRAAARATANKVLRSIVTQEVTCKGQMGARGLLNTLRDALFVSSSCGPHAQTAHAHAHAESTSNALALQHKQKHKKHGRPIVIANVAPPKQLARTKERHTVSSQLSQPHKQNNTTQKGLGSEEGGRQREGGAEGGEGGRSGTDVVRRSVWFNRFSLPHCTPYLSSPQPHLCCPSVVCM